MIGYVQYVEKVKKYLKGKSKSCLFVFTALDFNEKFDIITKYEKDETFRGKTNMEEKVLIFGHKNPDTDTICSSLAKEILFKKFGKYNVKAVRLGNVNKETQYALDYLNMEAPELIERVEKGQKVILVDHNEFNQSADGIEDAEILEVVDHHRICNFQTTDPLYYSAKPYGCTATILYQEFLEKEIEIEKPEAVLMASAIISDTLLLKSPTTTKYDAKALGNLGRIAGIEINKYGLEMLKAGTDLDGFTEKELINMDAKKFETKGVKCVIAQVNTVSISDVMKRKAKLESEIKDAIIENNLNLFVLAITDILNSNSQIIVFGNRTDIIEKSVKLEDNTALLEGVVSRKKQLLPMIENNI